jgi:acetyl esterase/lipase
MKPSLAAVHPELQEAARKMPVLVLSKQSIWLFQMLPRILIRGAKMPAGITVRNQVIPGPNGKTRLRLRIYQNQNSPAQSPALLWIHGGGYVIGVPEMDDGYVLPFVQEAGALVISVDYRLAPGAPFPAALDDCYAALLWVASQSADLGIDPRRIAVGGGSVGAGLAAALAQLARQRGQVKPVGQLLVYPMLDDRSAARTDIDPQAHFAWNNANNYFGWQAYLKQPPGGAVVPAHSVPARQPHLADLPPAWIGVGDLDLFYAEDVAYAGRLQQAGVPCELAVVPGAFHGFDTLAPNAPVVKEFRRVQVAALKKFFARSSRSG